MSTYLTFYLIYMPNTPSAYPESLAIREATASTPKKNTETYAPKKPSWENQARMQQDRTKDQNDAAALIRALDNGIITSKELQDSINISPDGTSVKYNGMQYASTWKYGVIWLKSQRHPDMPPSRKRSSAPYGIYKWPDWYIEVRWTEVDGKFKLPENWTAKVTRLDAGLAESYIKNNQEMQEDWQSKVEILKLGGVASELYQKNTGKEGKNFMGEAGSHALTTDTTVGSMVFNDWNGIRMRISLDGTYRKLWKNDK